MQNISLGGTAVPQLSVYSVSQVAQMLGVSIDKIYELVRCGSIPHKRLGKRRIIIPAQPFNEWLNTCTEWESANA